MLSYLQDWRDPEYLAAETEFESLSSRALVLAQTEPISEKGAAQLLRHDPQTQGPRLFAKHCVSCHSHADAQGKGLTAADPSAPNLYGIGTKNWIAGFLDPQRIVSDDYFGRTKFRDGDMVNHVQGLFSDAGEDGAADMKQNLQAVAAALAAEAGGDEIYDSLAATNGRTIISTKAGCTDCHRFHDQGESGSAPDLTGYASIDWLKRMIAKPNDERFYGVRSDRMPQFAADAAHPELNLLSSEELDLLIHWLHRSNTDIATQVPTTMSPRPHALRLAAEE